MLAVLGFGFMIFVHELGHFLAAKLVGVRVERFSFGMGPRLFGRKWGQTDYMVSAVPIGGYVKMAGGDEGEESKGAPDEFVSKSPGRRALIIFAGPLFSVLFGFPLMMGVYLIGRDMLMPQVSHVLIDSPAWEAGVKHGDCIERFGDEAIETFAQLRIAVLSSPSGESLPLVVRRGGHTLTLDVTLPKQEELGVVCAFETTEVSLITPNSPAAEAGIEKGDVLKTLNGEPIRGWTHFRRRVLSRPGETVTLGIERGGSPLTVEVTPRPVPRKTPGFTVRLPREIGGVRKGFPADGTLKVGDRIVKVNDRAVEDWWAIEDAVAEGPAAVSLTVERGEETLTVELARAWGHCAADTLGLTPRLTYIVADVQTTTEPQIQPGDELVTVGEDVARAFRERALLYQPPRDILPDIAGVKSLTVRRGDETLEIAIQPSEIEVGQLGVKATCRSTLFKTGLIGSLRPAFVETVAAAKLVYVVLRKLIGRDVPSGAVAGPLGILQITYIQATQGFSELLHLIGMITVNIGVLNLLPLPPLDGGRLVFLAYEKLRGKAPNRRVQEIILLTGVALLVVVLLWATKNDIVRIMESLKGGLL